jgi:hypothetical protein
VNFTTDNDIVGGNSGSPMLNAKGEIVGLAFDGNIHSISGSYWFDERLNRSSACIRLTSGPRSRRCTTGSAAGGNRPALKPTHAQRPKRPLPCSSGRFFLFVNRRLKLLDRHLDNLALEVRGTRHVVIGHHGLVVHADVDTFVCGERERLGLRDVALSHDLAVDAQD